MVRKLTTLLVGIFISTIALASGSGVSAANTGIAVLKVETTFGGCSPATFWLGTKQGSEFKNIKSVSVGGLGALLFGDGSAELSTVELAPGTYYIVEYSCTDGVGGSIRISGDTGSWTSKYTKSLAHFSVRKGEVVNAGFLQMVRIGSTQSFVFKVKPLPAKDLAKLRKKQPKIYARMRKRYMKADGLK